MSEQEQVAEEQQVKVLNREGAPEQIEITEAEALKYHLLCESIRACQLSIQLQQEKLNGLMASCRDFILALEKKYNVDLKHYEVGPGNKLTKKIR